MCEMKLMALRALPGRCERTTGTTAFESFFHDLLFLGVVMDAYVSVDGRRPRDRGLPGRHPATTLVSYALARLRYKNEQNSSRENFWEP